MSLPKLRVPSRADAIGLAALAVVTAVAYFAGFDPLVRAQAERAGAEERLRDAKAEVSKRSRRVIEDRATARELEQKLGTLEVKLEQAGAINDRLARLTRLASGLAVDSLQPGAPVFQARYGTVPIRLQAHGTYPQCAAFLRDLATTHRDMSVESLDLSGNADDPVNPPALVLNLRWYVAPADGHSQEN